MKMKVFSVLLLLSCIVSTCESKFLNESTTLKHYIVYMGPHSFPNSDDVITANHEMLALAMDSSNEVARNAIVYHYHKSFRGFSALLTQEHAERIANHKSVVRIFESKSLHLQTTRSWDFMEGNPGGQFKDYSINEKYDVIVGHFDSGVWPESPSFNPENMGSVPKRFKGECVTGDRFSSDNCNRKIIGARYYYKGYETDEGSLESKGLPFFRSPRDDYGHGSHTASTAAGSVVNNVNIVGMGGNVSPRGGAPNARLAIYKVCWFNICNCADIYSAFDDAIYDGVDIITMSIAGGKVENYFDDCFTMSTFAAFRNGIMVVVSAGNFGDYNTVRNPAPWVLTVAASSVDREFNSWVSLGNSKLLGVSTTKKGYGFNQVESMGTRPILAAVGAPAYGVATRYAQLCNENSLDKSFVNGRIVVCSIKSENDDLTVKSNAVAEAGGVGMIVVTPNSKYETYGFSIPTSLIGIEEGEELQFYLNTEMNPTARILNTRVSLNDKPAPKVASFSSKGPSVATPNIIKPDITAPGLNILAAYPPNANEKPDSITYGLDSGTSMSAPHVAGVAAIIKALNKGFSPAAIKSAIMTTALTWDNTGGPIQSGTSSATPFDMGSGHLHPDGALNPGLIYDFDVNDIASFLCTYGIDNQFLENLLGDKGAYCTYPSTPHYNLNYPSIGISEMNGPVSVTRTLTYVGKRSDEPLVFTASIEYPEGVEVRVVPDVLDFTSDERLSFRVDFFPRIPMGRYVFGSIAWSNGVHNVRSPLALKVIN